MINSLTSIFQATESYRNLVVIGIPLLGGAMVVASSPLMPRGKAKGVLTGAYMFLASVGAACLLFALIGAITGIPRTSVALFLLPGIVLTVIMGIFSGETIREYQRFELRKLAAGIFRSS
jgi:hypothetical protein